MNEDRTFTIKHVTQHGSTLWPGVTRVAFDAPHSSDSCGTVFADMPDATGSFDSGTVYVLNAAGRTVDTFRLKGVDPHIA